MRVTGKGDLSTCVLEDSAMLKRVWREEEGVLTFEWILLMTLLVIGVIGGVAGIRDAVLHETQGVVGAMVSLDQSYEVVPPLGVGVDSLIPSAQTATPARCTAHLTIPHTGRADASLRPSL